MASNNYLCCPGCGQDLGILRSEVNPQERQWCARCDPDFNLPANGDDEKPMGYRPPPSTERIKIPVRKLPRPGA
jgi:hypothetical protein